MKEAQRGFRDKLNNYINPDNPFSVKLEIDGNDVYDFTCFGLDSNGKLSDDRYMVFFNQLKTPNDEISVSLNPGSANFNVNLSKLPSSINKLVFTGSLDGGGLIKNARSIKITAADSLQLTLTGNDFASEKAIIALEIYKKDVWRVSFVASGFNEGLSALLRLYGGEEIESQPKAESKPPAKPLPPPVLLEQPKPVLTKIVLEKGKKIQLAKNQSKEIIIENGWTAPNKDYDLKALVRYHNGRLLYVGAANKDEVLQTPEGAIRHGGDVREPGELEKIIIKWHKDIASVAISSYSALENGEGSFRQYGVFVRIKNGQQVIEIPAASTSAKSNSYTLCFGEIIYLPEPDSMEVINLEMYSHANSENRIGYKGSKVKMDIGPVGQPK
jgi:tellurium resistance protein TerD